MMESPQTTGTIRRCVFRDLDRVIPIYNFYVSNTVASLDIEPKPLLYMQRLFNSVADQNLPFLVVTASNDSNAPRNQEEILGYAYAHFYRRLPAFGGTVEILVYLDHTATGQGIGEKLVNVLLAMLRDLGPGIDREHGIREVLAIVPVDEGRDASGFFLRQRFENRGVLRGVAWKMGRWVDTKTLQRSLNEESTEEEKPGREKRRSPRQWWRTLLRRS